MRSLSPAESALAVRIDAAAIAPHYALLNRMGGNTTNGFDRPAYSDEETRVMLYFRQLAEACGLAHRFDTCGNLIIETTSISGQWIETGSHVDTVPGGGNYDGLAGVVAGFEALKAIRHYNRPFKHGLRLRIWRGEESASFGIASIGSRAAFGQLPPSSLSMTCRGKTMAEAMTAQGINPEVVEQGRPAIATDELDNIAACIELHIEQGKVLETAQLDIGIVSAIRGSRRSWVSLTGTFDHSGATPMGCHYRQDCNLAMAYMHVRLDQLLQKHIEKGVDLVQTVGVINSHSGMHKKLAIDNNAVSKVSGAAFFSFEVRGCKAEEVTAYCAQAEAEICKTADEFGIRSDIEIFSEQQGLATLDETLQHCMEQLCDSLKLSHMLMPSGAWHDAGTVAQQRRADGSSIPVGIIFIPCKEGISHSPLESTSPEQIATGATLLAATMLQLAMQD